MPPARGADGTGATREGCALLQGLAICGVCGRGLGVFYRGPAKTVPGYQCNGGGLVGGGQGRFCTRVSGLRIDPAVAGHVLEVLTPLALQAALDAADQIEAGHDAALDQWRRQAEQARYAATRAERRYRAVDPENRLVARGLEAEWEAALQAARDAQAELDRREAARPVRLSADERAKILAIATGLPALWAAPSTTDRDRKELLHTLLDDVVITADDQARNARLVLHWKGGMISETTADLPRPRPPYRTSEDTIELIGRLAAHYDDTMITKVPSQQRSRTATGMSLTPANMATIRKRRGIPAPPVTGSACTRPQPSSASPPPPSTGGSTTGSSPASRSPPARPGGSASPTPSAPSSPTTRPPGGYPYGLPPSPSASPARPCCSVSTTASFAPSISAPDAGKACVSSCQSPKTACSSRTPTVKEQCDVQSTTSVTSPTAKTSPPRALATGPTSWPPCATSPSASCASPAAPASPRPSATPHGTPNARSACSQTQVTVSNGTTQRPWGSA